MTRLNAPFSGQPRRPKPATANTGGVFTAKVAAVATGALPGATHKKADHAAAAAKARPPEKREPLTDQRFHSLLSAAGAFFASFERDMEAERTAAITEILALMQRYGLSVEDVAPGDCVMEDAAPFA